jgi:hypothetical protein
MIYKLAHCLKYGEIYLEALKSLSNNDLSKHKRNIARIGLRVICCRVMVTNSNCNCKLTTASYYR